MNWLKKLGSAWNRWPTSFMLFAYITRSPIIRIALLAVMAMILPCPAMAEVQYHAVLPSATDIAITGADAPHRIYFDPTVRHRNQLLVFLPGTGGRNVGKPREFSVTAAELGYHVIDLAYPNNISATVCWRESDSSCFESFRREIIDGRDTSPLIAIGRADSVENRLEKLLRLLDVQEPGKGWKEFLAPAGGLAWEKMALAGQSQGGGHAALIARDHQVARVLMFSAPKDYNLQLHKPAPWYRQGQTPVQRFFAFAHALDKQGCDLSQQLEIFRALGITSQAVLVDGVSAPYGGAHILLTNFPGRKISSLQAHVVGISNGLRDSSGAPLFKPVWTYMLTASE